MSDTTGGTGRRAYEGRSITVTFEAGRCRHAAECVRGLPEVFDPARRPWIRPDAADAGRVAEVVRRCPSGALRYEGGGEADGEAGGEEPPHPSPPHPPTGAADPE
ncbi:(4Fe-4S)-binding protein [Streptomyces bacillaris]|uniref:(4Fe-4S)-binding protein n=1 Tax=Streptomyces sp. CcalMP-8W TaxID=1155715 RepID=UPI0003799C29|nr:(4Fe-4S)-binding protein [Streptomyces sp. SID8356]